MSLAWTSSPVWLVVNLLVAFRLTRLWIEDALPPLPAVRARIKAYIHRDEESTDPVRSERYYRRENLYGRQPLMSLLDCYWCVGFWASLGVVLVASALPVAVWAWFALPLALSALVGLLGRLD